MQIVEIRAKLSGVLPQLGDVEKLDVFLSLVRDFLPQSGEITTRHLLLAYTTAVVAYKSTMMSSEMASWTDIMQRDGSFTGKQIDILKMEKLRNEILEQLDRQAARAKALLEDLP